MTPLLAPGRKWLRFAILTLSSEYHCIIPDRTLSQTVGSSWTLFLLRPSPSRPQQPGMFSSSFSLGTAMEEVFSTSTFFKLSRLETLLYGIRPLIELNFPISLFMSYFSFEEHRTNIRDVVRRSSLYLLLFCCLLH